MLRDRLALVPLRVRLVAAVLALSSVALAASALLSTSVLRGYLLDRVDGELRAATAEAPRPRGGVACGDLGTGAPGAFGPGRGPERGSGGDRAGDGPGGPSPFSRFYVVYEQADGVACYLPSGDGAPDLPEDPPSDAPFSVDAVEGGARWRVVVEAQPDGGSLTVATTLTGVEDTVGRLLAIQAAVSVGLLALLAGASRAVVRRSLRPLREVERTAAGIAAGDLTHRVPRQDDRTEVGRLATAFNAMLSRLEGSFRAQQGSEAAARASEARMRRFVGDASHELRTPLTSIRGFAELYRSGAVQPGEDLDRVMARVEGEATRMGSLVDELLLLARLDQHRPLETRPVDLLALAADAVQDARALGVDVVLQGEPVVVHGDEGRLRQVLVNLLGNARAHTPPGTRVVVRVSADGVRARVEVQDDGPGLTPEQADRAFERFYRADASRTRASGGSGLGLSIVAAVAEAHGGRAGVRPAPGGGATFTVELPLAPGDAAPEAGLRRRDD